MARIRAWCLLVLGCWLWAVVAGAGSAAPVRAVLPLAGPVVRAFDPPAQPWLAGHRGVDLLGRPGTEVVAALAGRVVFAGAVAGREVVVVSHGERRTTYLPVRALLGVGAVVAAGEPIGRLLAGHSCPGGHCLHWGLKRGGEYLDPLGLLDGSALRLLPADSPGQVAAVVAYRHRALSAGGEVLGVLSRPVPGGVGSPFGPRLHPVLHVQRLHAGVDLQAGCGEPIRAAAPGRVARLSVDEESGHRLELDHGDVGGHRLTSVYLHARGWSVTTGAVVTRGQVVGRVGSTGLSTGCHLHFGVLVDGAYVDPERFLSG